MAITATQIRIDTELYSKLKEIAEKERRSFNAQLEYAVEKFIQWYEEQPPALPPKMQHSPLF